MPIVRIGMEMTPDYLWADSESIHADYCTKRATAIKFVLWTHWKIVMMQVLALIPNVMRSASSRDH